MQLLLGYEPFISKPSALPHTSGADRIVLRPTAAEAQQQSSIRFTKESLPILRTLQHNARLECAFPVNRCKQLKFNPEPAIRIR